VFNEADSHTSQMQFCVLLEKEILNNHVNNLNELAQRQQQGEEVV
jgi:hypothetical protein